MNILFASVVSDDPVALPSHAFLLGHRHAQQRILFSALLGCIWEDGCYRPLPIPPNRLCCVYRLINLVLRLINGYPWRDKRALKLVVALDAEVREFTWLSLVASVLCR
jgi:hypothetical protein